MSGCASPKGPPPTPERPDVSPEREPRQGQSDAPSQEAPTLVLEPGRVKPMYSEILAIDLPTTIMVAAAQNIDIRHARQEVEASRGNYESTVGSALPVLAPTAVFEHVEGTVRATEGNLVGVNFNTFQASAAIQWIINPGKVVYDILAARKRLAATEHLERAVVLEIMRLAAVQFYDLVFAQSRISTAHQGVMEAEELLRISRLRLRTGVGLPADVLRAEAQLAERQQELVSAVQAFGDASVALAVTLHLDPTVTLAPKMEMLPPVTLVRDDLQIAEMLEMAIAFRPDLQSVRELVEAAVAARGATWWGAFGPEFALGYQYGGITGNAGGTGGGQGIPGNLIVNPASPGGAFSANPVANGLIREAIGRGSRRRDRRDETFGFSDQQRGHAGAGWRLSLAAFGDLKTADARQRQSMLEAERQFDIVLAEVVAADQTAKANRELIDLARQQVTAAEEALRLSEANLRAGTMTTLDVLQAQDAAARARLSYAGAVVQYNQSQLDLLAALGLLDEQSLGIITADAPSSGDLGIKSPDPEGDKAPA